MTSTVHAPGPTTMSTVQPSQVTADRRRPANVCEADLIAFVRSSLLGSGARANLAKPGLCTLVMPLPHRFDALALLGSLRGVDAWYFKGPSGWQGAPTATERLGLGSTRRLMPSGPSRFVEARKEIARWAEETAIVSFPGVTECADAGRAFVGFSFAPGAAASEPWENFGDALVVLPRWTLAQTTHADAATLELTLDRGERSSAQVDAIVLELQSLLSARPHPSSSTGALTVRDEPTEEHLARVQAALDEIATGALEKVVVARRSAIYAEHDFDPIHTLKELLARHAEGAVYFVRRQGSVFLGVTPERLLSVRGRALSTFALAGTAAAGEAEKLERSLKDQNEHRFVVTSIEESLLPLSTSVRVARPPEISTAGSVVHLKTRITAQLREDVHALSVAEALHPTPAVGGTPKMEATSWIARTEPERGWYGGPIGWVDPRGDAELFVALRGGVMRGARAWAYSGGGIVLGSEPGQELAEAQLKMRSFLRALGMT